MMRYYVAPHQEDEVSETNDLRVTTRVVLFLALLTTLFYVWIAAEEAVAALLHEPPATAPLVVFGLLLAGLVSLLLTLRWPIHSGALAIVLGLVISLVVYLGPADYPFLAAFTYGSPFVVTGVVTVVYGTRDRYTVEAANKG